MNIWEDKFPADLNNLLAESVNIAKDLRSKLNDINCLSINDLYLEKNGKNYIQKGLFEKLGYHPNSQQNPKTKKYKEFKGIYLFGERNALGAVVPVYIGISRTIYRRLRQHGCGSLHTEATLAYIIANHELYDNNFSNGRANLPHSELHDARNKIRNFKVALYPIENNYELYFHEVAIAGIFKTMYNSFKTH